MIFENIFSHPKRMLEVKSMLLTTIFAKLLASMIDMKHKE